MRFVLAVLLAGGAVACSGDSVSGPEGDLGVDGRTDVGTGPTSDVGTGARTEVGTGPTTDAGTLTRVDTGADKPRDSGSTPASEVRSDPGDIKPLGDINAGTLSIGPVDFAETYFGNACAPYPDPLPALYSNLLVAVQTDQIQAGKMCDACVHVTAATGRSAIARVINYGVMGPNDIDVSPELNQALGITDEAGRAVRWRFIECPAQGPMYFKFWDGGHQWYFKVWIRNQRVPVKSVEVKIPGHDYVPIDRGQNSEWAAQARPNTDFLAGFTLRVTSIQGSVVEQAFPTGPAVYAEPLIAASSNL